MAFLFGEWIVGSCKQCGRCCQILSIHFSVIEFDDKWVEGHGGVRRGMDVYLPLRCKWLTEDNKCEIHKDKPEFCKKWPENIGPTQWLLNMGCKYFD